MRARLLLNPASGRRRGARWRERLASLARAADVEFEESSSARDLAQRARRAAAEGVERLLVAGGDGTWHWAAQGLAGSATALAPLALGTGNDLARELGLPLDAELAFAAGLAGAVDRIDLGRIGDRLFCGVAGVGFDAAVAERARRVRLLRGPAVYAWATLAGLAGFRPPRAALRTVEGAAVEGEVFFVVFANTSHYGGGMRIAPAADPGDGLLELVVVRRCSKLRLLRLFPRVYRGNHVGDPFVTVLRSRAASVEMAPPQPINADGEGLGLMPVGGLSVGVERRALAVVRGAVLQ